MDTKRIIRNCEDKLGRTVYVLPDIPDSQLAAALKGITGAMVPKETVVAVVDTSAMKVFDSGLVFTEDAVYFNAPLSNPLRIEYGDIGRTKIYSSLPGKLIVMDKKGQTLGEFPGTNLQIEAVAKLLDTLASAAKEDAGDEWLAGSGEEEKVEERRTRFERVWAELEKSSRRWLIAGIVLCFTGVGLFWGIAAIVVGYWFLKKRHEDADLPDSELPASLYEADVKELRSSAWQNVLVAPGTFGIVDMCGKSRRRMEAMADAVKGLTVLPLEDVIRRYKEAFAARADHLPFFLSAYNPKAPNFGDKIVDFELALFSKGSKFNLRALNPRRYVWYVRAKEDPMARKFVRGQLARMAKRGKVRCVRLGGAVFAFTPDGFRAAAERTESIVGSANRVSWEELSYGLRDVVSMDSREAGLFAEEAGIGIRTYFFADGRHCVAGGDNERVEICPVCGTAFWQGEGCEGFCSDYCRTTNEQCGEDIQTLMANRRGAGGMALPAGREIVKAGAMGAASGMKSAVVFGSGLAAGQIGKYAGAVALGFLPGGVFVGGLIGRTVGKKLGRLIVRAGTDSLEDDHTIAAISALYDEFGILAAMYGMNGDESVKALQKLEKLMAEKAHFVEEVRSQGDNRRRYLARLMQPLFLEVCQIRPPLPETGTGEETSARELAASE